MKNVIWLALNTFKLNFRKKSKVISIVVLPILSVVISILVNGVSQNAPVKVGILDRDRSVVSRNFVKDISKEKKFEVETIAEDKVDNSITSGNIECVIIIPHGFEQSIYSNEIKKFQIKSLKGTASTAWIDNYSNTYLNNLMDMWKAANGSKKLFSRISVGTPKREISLNIKNVRNTATDKQVTSQSVGFLIMFLMLNASIAAGFILSEKKNRTYFRICSSPVNSKVYVLGNILASFFIVTIQILVALLILIYMFKIKTYIPFSQFFILLLCFGITAVAFGLMIVSFAKNSSESDYIMTLIITPTCMVSGCFVPYDLMPKTIQKIAYFLPQRWTFDAIEKLQNGNSFSSIFLNIIIVLGFAFMFFIVSAYKFSKNNDVKNFV